jgi:hypothetical protein
MMALPAAVGAPGVTADGAVGTLEVPVVVALPHPTEHAVNTSRATRLAALNVIISNSQALTASLCGS